MKEQKILLKAKHVLNTNKGDTSIYYKQLKTAVKEYKNLKNKDKTTIDIYLEHISKLCELIDEKKSINTSILIVIIAFTLMLFITLYSTIQYNSLTKNKKNTTLVVQYKNLETFNKLVLGNNDTYKTLKPLNLTIKPISKYNENTKMQYNIYLVESNSHYDKNLVLSRNTINYSVMVNNKEETKNRLSYTNSNNNKILLYSSEILANELDNIALRIWLDDTLNEDYLNKYYNYEIVVEGYEK